MSGRYEAHAEYQDSGLDWLGRVPKSWELRRLGSYFQERRTKVSDADFPALSVTMQGIVPQLETAAKTDDGDNRKLVRAGDFVINSRSDRKGSSGVSPFDGSVSLISIVLNPINLHPPFVHHLLRSTAFQEEFYRFGKGIVADLWSTNYAAMKNIVIPVMPSEDQIRIANFLDYETVKIDALIEKQQQLIALLKEKRQAVISHAVTKGLNPEAPMRDSGIEWLGAVPAHWGTSRLKFLVSNVVDCHHSTPKYDPDAPCPAIRTADVAPGNLDIEGARRVHLDEYEERISRLKPESGDIIYSREGERWGIAAPVPEGADVCLAQRVMLFRSNAMIESEFLMWGLNSMPVYNQLAVHVVGATSPHVNISDIREVLLAVPPRAEQAKIVAYLQGVLRKLDELDSQCSYLIAALQERRTALISAAVTGKIDVRGWKAPESEMKADLA